MNPSIDDRLASIIRSLTDIFCRLCLAKRDLPRSKLTWRSAI
jgi:hypothetical protein